MSIFSTKKTFIIQLTCSVSSAKKVFLVSIKLSFISCDTTGTRKLRAGISLTTKKKQQLGNYKSSKDKFQSLNLLSKEKMDGSSIVLNGKV